MSSSACSNDNTFGPAVYGCRDNFDFTIEFEQLIFSIVPLSIFVAISTWRIVCISRLPALVDATPWLFAKIASITVYMGLNLGILVLVAKQSSAVTNTAVASSTLQFVTGICMLALSFFEHTRCPRPSMLLGAYLSLTILLDGARVRTLWLETVLSPEHTTAVLSTASIATKAVILVLEAQPKTKWVKWDSVAHSPEETSGIYSLGVYFWLNSLLVSGYRKVLRIEDLFPLDKALGSHALQQRLYRHLSYSKLRRDNWGLAKALIRTLAIALVLPIPSRLALLGFSMCQPFFISSLLEYLTAPEDSRPNNAGYGFIGASICIYGGIAVSTALYWYSQQRMLYMIRGVLVSAIYRKTTECRPSDGVDMAAVTLMSTDTERINVDFRNLHEFWANPIEIALASWLLYLQLGAAFVAPIVVVVCCALSLGCLVRYIGPAQRTWMGMIQKRVGMTANIIANMKNLKISGLTAAITDFVQQLRVDELEAGSMARQLSLTAAIIAFVPLAVSPFVTFAVAQHNIDISNLFTSLSFLLLLSNPLLQLFQSVPQIVAGLACLSRIQAFLEREDHEDFRLAYNVPSSGDRGASICSIGERAKVDSIPELAITIKDGNFGWEQGKMTLHNVNIDIPLSAITIVVGPVASGKSTLCKALLGEIPYRNGKLHLADRFARVGYCDQNPFLSNGTVKSNIVGFSKFNPQRYAEVVEATLLGTDFEMLPQGDDSSVGSNGITLSGGQRQRVSLARALYLQTELLVLDDIFSGLDVDTEDKVFHRVFGPEGIVSRRRVTAVLCTHSTRHVSQADHLIVLGTGGTVVEQGRFEQLLVNQGSIYSIGLNNSGTGVSSDESYTNGSTRKSRKPELPPANIIAMPWTPETDQDRRYQDRRRQIGDSAVYFHYSKSIGLITTGLILILGVFLGFFYNFPTIWLKYWSDAASSTSPAHQSGFYIGIYAMLELCILVSLAALGFILFIVAMKKAGTALHREALGTLIHAPLRFFTATDQGVITNLFSQDINLIDTELPIALLALVYSSFVAIGQAAVLSTSSPYMAISYPFLAALLYIVQTFYLRSSRQLRLLDLETKSPLYTHFLDTVNGILTLRAFGFVTEVRAKATELLDKSQRPAYLLIMVQQWLNLVLNMIVMVMAVILTALAVKLRSNSGFTGASLVTLMQFSVTLSGIVTFYTMLETSMGAISRLRTFSEKVTAEDEKDIEDIEPPEDWPQRGSIEFNNVSASYSVDDKNLAANMSPTLALRNISLKISSGEKVAICGRTGSGKSSLIAVLLKLLNPLPTQRTAEEGEHMISIDSTPLYRIQRLALRSRIIALPQDAVFLPDGASFQANLDPTSLLATSAECESVLRIVHLWNFVQDRGGLTAGMTASTLSQGQRQLFSLARVILRRRIRSRSLAGASSHAARSEDSEGGLLLLDEVSSSVDRETEQVMQESIRQEFKRYTVVAVTHRLDMIMDFDRVVVMDKGEMVEVGNPRTLATSRGTRFHELCSSGGREVTKSPQR